MHSLNSSANLSYSQYNPQIHFNTASPLNEQQKSTNTEFESSHLFTNYSSKYPLGDTKYRNFIDCGDRIVQLAELRQRIFDGGCDPSRRQELWPILLDIYPSQSSMTSRQRTEFIKLKSVELNKFIKYLIRMSVLPKNSATRMSHYLRICQ